MQKLNIPTRIFLTGMPASGKSTLARLLAEKLHYTFIDTDIEIERKTDKTIAEIFKTEGEEKFRRYESEILKGIISSDEKVLVATGGGTPCFNDNMKLMNESGQTIYLKCTIDLLENRIVTFNENNRPLLYKSYEKSIRERLDKLFLRRKNFYELAKTLINVVDNPDLDVANIYSNIIS